MEQPTVSPAAVNAIGGHFHFANATEGEQQFCEGFGRLFRVLFHDVGNRIADGGLAEQEKMEETMETPEKPIDRDRPSHGRT